MVEFPALSIEDVERKVEELKSSGVITFEDLAMAKGKTEDIYRVAIVTAYIRYRMEGLSRSEAYIKATGENLNDVLAGRRALSIERTELFNRISSKLQADMYVTFAVDRYKVLNNLLEIALNDETDDRGRRKVSVRMQLDASKVFLEHTQKEGDMLPQMGSYLDRQEEILAKMENALENKGEEITDADSLLDIINADIVDE